MFLGASGLVFDTNIKFEQRLYAYVIKVLTILLTYYVSYTLFRRNSSSKLLIGVIGAIFFSFYGYFFYEHFYHERFLKHDLLYFFFVCICLKTAEKPADKDPADLIKIDQMKKISQEREQMIKQE